MTKIKGFLRNGVYGTFVEFDTGAIFDTVDGGSFDLDTLPFWVEGMDASQMIESANEYGVEWVDESEWFEFTNTLWGIDDTIDDIDLYVGANL